MANNVVVKHFRGTQAQAEMWVELQQISHCDMEEVGCGVLDVNEPYLYLGVQAGSDSKLKATAEPHLSLVDSDGAASLVN